MPNKIDDRYPIDLGTGCYESIPAVRTPWDRLISFHDAYHYAQRGYASMGAVFMQALRILIPDYDERLQHMCNGMNLSVLRGTPYRTGMMDQSVAHTGAFPFVNPYLKEMLQGDRDDETILLPGCVMDFNHHRFEKEIYACPCDIVGSEICRMTTYAFDQIGKLFNDEGDIDMDLNMVEARGCGHLHCRLVGEDRAKYPLPEAEGKKPYDVLGPIATGDQITYTPEEEMLKEAQIFRSECGYRYRNGINKEYTAAEQWHKGLASPFGPNMICGSIVSAEPDEAKRVHLINCLFETAGKMAFSEFAAIKGIRDWLGVPADVNDGRVLGGLIEVVLQSNGTPYTVVAFNKDEVVLDIDRSKLGRDTPLMVEAYLAMWNGMAKTLVSARYFAWEEKEGVEEGKLRLKIANKVDTYC